MKNTISKKLKESNKKGFTLVELLVTIACSAIFLITLTMVFVFVQKINNNLIKKSSNMYKVRNVKNYILNNYNDNDTITVDGNDIYYNIYEGESKKIASNTDIKSVVITTTDDYVYCTITYDINTLKEFKFIIKPSNN